MLHHTMQLATNLEENCTTYEDVISKLQFTSLDEYGEILLSLPHPELPRLSSMLPRPTPDYVQHAWTGSSGEALLSQSVSFINFLAASSAELLGRRLSALKVLDFGCGWGRLLRLMTYYVPEDRLFGCDTWDSSLEHVRAAAIRANIAKSDTEARTLPFGDQKFDLIYAFSIFTHLGEAVAAACMEGIRKSIEDDGLLIITVRPEEFWYNTSSFNFAIDSDRLRDDHRTLGVAKIPLEHSASEDYTEISLSLDYLRTKFPHWEVVRFGRTLIDKQQIFVCLRPV